MSNSLRLDEMRSWTDNSNAEREKGSSRAVAPPWCGMLIFLVDHDIMFVTAHEPRYVESAEVFNEGIEIKAALHR